MNNYDTWIRASQSYPFDHLVLPTDLLPLHLPAFLSLPRQNFHTFFTFFSHVFPSFGPIWETGTFCNDDSSRKASYHGFQRDPPTTNFNSSYQKPLPPDLLSSDRLALFLLALNILWSFQGFLCVFWFIDWVSWAYSIDSLGELSLESSTGASARPTFLGITRNVPKSFQARPILFHFNYLLCSHETIHRGILHTWITMDSGFQHRFPPWVLPQTIYSCFRPIFFHRIFYLYTSQKVQAIIPISIYFPFASTNPSGPTTQQTAIIHTTDWFILDSNIVTPAASSPMDHLCCSSIGSSTCTLPNHFKQPFQAAFPFPLLHLLLLDSPCDRPESFTPLIGLSWIPTSTLPPRVLPWIIYSCFYRSSSIASSS